MLGIMQRSSPRQKLYWLTILTALGLVSSVPVLFRAFFKGGETVATVNGIGIDQREYRFAVMREEQLINLYRQQFGAYYQKILAMLGKSERPQEAALEQLIVEKLLLSVANKLPLELSPLYVGSELRRARVVYNVLGEAIPQYLFTKDGLLDYTTLKIFLQRQGLSVAHFEEMVESLLKEQIILQLVQGAVSIPESLLQAEMTKLYREKSFSFETIDLAPYEQEVAMEGVSEQTLRSYYEEQNRLKSRFWSDERRSGIVWIFDMNSYGLDAKKIAGLSANEKESSFSQVFSHEAGYVAQNGQDKLFHSYLEEKRPKRTELQAVTEINDPAIGALFSLNAIGERGFAVHGKRGYIVELQAIVPREEIPYEEVADRVKADFVKERARGRVEALWHSPVSAATRGYRATTVSIDPAHVAAIPAFVAFGLKRGVVNGLIHEGMRRTGMTEQGAYRITLTKLAAIQESRLAERGGVGQLVQHLYSVIGPRIVENFVASLRDNAILSLPVIAQKLG